MSKVVKISSVGPLFRTGGFELSKAWSTIDLEKINDEQTETLRKRLGRWIRVHPSDRETVDAHIARLNGAEAPKARGGKPTQTTIDNATNQPATADKRAAKAAGKEG